LAGDQRLRVAIIGCGGVARAHATALASVPETELVITVDLDKERAKETAQLVGTEVRWSQDADAVLADPNVDAVAVLLPNHLHAPITLGALRQGKHVLVEKPMALTLADCAAMIQEAERQGLHLAVGQVLRFRNALVFGRQVVAGGELGQPVSSVRRRYARRGSATQRPWDFDTKTSGGLLYGNGSHEMDALLWMVGARPVDVYAHGGFLAGEDRSRGPTELTVVVSTDQGGSLTLLMSRGMSQGAWDHWVVGTEGDLYLAGNKVTVNGTSHDRPLQSNEDFYNEWDDLASAIRENRPSAADARSVWGTMVALECAKLSIQGGRQVRAAEVDSWELYKRK
jgi:predicted dehydrogenase